MLKQSTGNRSASQELIAAANWIMDPSRPTAAPVAMEQAEDAVRHTVE
jgi:hypothetical protein